MCDYRRAVVVISIIYMIYYFIACILWFTGATTAIIFGAATLYNEDVDSDAALVAGGAAYIVGSAAIVFFFCNLFNLCAALRYSTCMLTTTILIVLIEFGFSIWQTIELQNQIQISADEYNFETNPAAGLASGIIATIIAYGLYLYPLIGLNMEIKKGIMSRETYPREGTYRKVFCIHYSVYVYVYVYVYHLITTIFHIFRFKSLLSQHHVNSLFVLLSTKSLKKKQKGLLVCDFLGLWYQ